MAFTTELVLPAQTDPSVESWTVPTAAKTGNGAATIATTSVGAGTWLVVVTAPTYSSYTWSVSINGNTLTVRDPSDPNSGPSVASGTISHAVVVTGPTTVTASVPSSNYQRISAGTMRLARIG